MSLLEATRAQQPATAEQTTSARQPVSDNRTAGKALAVVRILLGSVFLWAFLDKTFGLGFATTPEASVIAGASPTAGYLGSLEGSFAPMFHAIAGNLLVDLGFMLGMLGLGVALILGVGLRLAGVGGVIMMGMLWLTALPLMNNPIIDEHVIYAAVVVALAATHAGNTWGTGLRNGPQQQPPVDSLNKIGASTAGSAFEGKPGINVLLIPDLADPAVRRIITDQPLPDRPRSGHDV